VEVSSLPTVFARINEAVNNPRSSLNEIAKIISEDAGLTARLLMVVNSAFFNFPQRIESISKAIGIVGTQQLRDIALATSIVKMFKGIPPDLVDMEKFWKHCIGVGIVARTLASYRREPNVERYFVAGILHDIGRLVMYMKIPDASREAIERARNNNELLYVAESEQIGFDHAAVGRALMQAWKLPFYQEEVVAFHHKPHLATRFPIETAIVHVADIVAHSMRLGGSGESFVPPLNQEAWERLALPVSVLGSTFEQVDRQFTDAVKMIV
jgi:HD-like signal output (HDOD) protein